MSEKPKTTTRASTRAKMIIVSNPPTTTRATRAKTANATPDTTVTTTKKPTARKPLVNKDNSVAFPVTASKPKPKAPTRKGAKVNGQSETAREAIMAYLRIRPHLGEDEPMSMPYLTPLSDTSVRMTDPQDPSNNRARFRPSTVPPTSIYTFSHVFPPDTNQSDFFSKTTLPLVRDVLSGQNSLLFTYGVTNSGKTYTVQGGTGKGTAGILPRTLDVVFNSIEGLHGDGSYRPVRLHGIEPAEATDSRPPQIAPEPAVTEVLGQHSTSEVDHDVDSTVIKLDRNYEYTIWLSYAEVYNEKVYDLLASVKDASDINADGTAPRAMGAKHLLLSRQALSLKPSPACDNLDTDFSGKYIAGLRQFRVHNASQAKALVKLGQLHRRVFGTLANRESSRSHGMVIIKVVKGHRGERDDPTALQVARLTLVDLAGSERTKHTHTTGDRLKEAGNINKSLMVLGQCMEVMRSNQRKLAVSLSQEGVGKEGRMNTQDVKKGLAVVPFRHSKLTEALMDYFIGDGRAVMILNVNPYDTGYDENSHVMKFAALAREVYVTPAPVPIRRIPTFVGKTQGSQIKELGPLTLNDPDILPNPFRRKVTISVGGPGNGKKVKETVLEVLEEDEPNDDQEEDGSGDDPSGSLVDELFDEIEVLRMRLFESEMRCAVIEADTREEVMREMEGRMRNMEQLYTRRMMSEFEQNELKTDAKIDMLHQSGLFNSPVKKQGRYNAESTLSEEEEDVEMSLTRSGEDEETESEAESSFILDRSMSTSPLAGKGSKLKPSARGYTSEIRKFVPDPPMLPSDVEDAVLTETEDGDEDEDESVAISITESEADDDESEYHDIEDDDDDDWKPSTSAGGKTPKANRIGKKLRSPSPDSLEKARPPPFKPTKNARVSQLERGVHRMALQDPDDSAIILPSKQFGSKEAFDDEQLENEDEFEVTAVKKKKRQLGKKPVMTEEDIEKATYAAEKQAAKTQGGKTIRRLRPS